MDKIKQEIMAAIRDDKDGLSKNFDFEDPYNELSTTDDLVLFGNICALEWVLHLLEQDTAP